MPTDNIQTREHVHLYTRSIDGAEFGNALYESDIDAAMSFLAIAQQMNKYKEGDRFEVSIEDVVNSMNGDGRGMYTGGPGFMLMLYRCDGGCKSPIWN